MVDVRERPLGENAFRFKLPKEAKDLESGNWHPKYENNFVVSSESGIVFGYDIRQTKGPLFTVHAHEKACSSVAFSTHIPNIMATASTDETVKIWDISHNNGTDPKLIHSKEMKTGELFTLQFYKDIPWVLAAGGSKGELAIWDISEN